MGVVLKQQHAKICLNSYSVIEWNHWKGAKGFCKDNVIMWGHQAKRARSWGHKGHSGVQTPRPSLCNTYILLNINFFILQDSHLCLVSIHTDDLSCKFFRGMASDMLLVRNGQ